MPVDKLKHFDHLQLDENDAAVSKRLLIEINNRIQFLLDVGLGYLTLNRLSNTLSGEVKVSASTSLPRLGVVWWFTVYSRRAKHRTSCPRYAFIDQSAETTSRSW